MSRRGKPVSFPFYFPDWLGDLAVRRLTSAQRGAYIDLLALCAQEHGLPDRNADAYASVLGCQPDDIDLVLKQFFTDRDAGRWWNAKLRAVMTESVGYVRRQRALGRVGAAQRDGRVDVLQALAHSDDADPAVAQAALAALDEVRRRQGKGRPPQGPHHGVHDGVGASPNGHVPQSPVHDGAAEPQPVAVQGVADDGPLDGGHDGPHDASYSISISSREQADTNVSASRIGQCMATTAKGTRCRRNAEPHARLCSMHAHAGSSDAASVHQRITRLWCETYERATGAAYVHLGARDGKAFKQLAKLAGLDGAPDAADAWGTLTERMERLLLHPPDNWYANNGSPSTLASRWNQLARSGRAGFKPQGRMSAGDIARLTKEVQP